MAGAGVSLRIDTSEIGPMTARLRGLADMDTSGLMPRLGEYLQNSTQERFKAEAGPDGSRWAVLQPRTRQRKRRNPSTILTERGFLRKNIQWQVTAPGRVEVGSSMVYAATHQFGRGKIPARPFLGLSRKDEEQVGEIVRDWLSELGKN